jgi:alanine racemase
MPNPRPTSAEIDLQAFRFNLDQIKRLIGPERGILAVIKANAYGHGAVRIGRVLMQEGVRHLGVATVEEGAALRRGGLNAVITVLGGVFPDQHDQLIEHDLTPVLYNLTWAEALSKTAAAAGTRRSVQIKIDTGMGRVGFALEEAEQAVAQIAELSGLELGGVLSHFADADLQDRAFTDRQLRRFVELEERISKQGIQVPFWHLSNSAAVMNFPGAFFNMVRPGIMLYGYPPSESFAGKVPLKPVLSWRTRIIHLKEVPPGTRLSYGGTFVTRRRSRIATLPVGYADGYPRRLSNRAEVLVGGRRSPVVGTVTMDMILVDVTDIDGVALGDRATLIGQDGAEKITAWDLGRWSETIAYEILCVIGARVPRHYLE